MKRKYKIIIFFGTLVCYSAAAFAELGNQGLFDQVLSEFAIRAEAWKGVILNAATWLFWTFGTISLTWTFGMMALRKADIQEFFAEFIRFILFFGFFLWLLRNGPMFASSIISSLSKLGEQASGISSITPSGVVDIGFMIWKQATDNMSIWSPIDSIVGLFLSVGILILLASVAVNMLLLLVSSWVLVYAGIFFLGFGGSRWTSDMAINYYKTVFGLAIQIFTMILLIGIGNNLLSSFYEKMNKAVLNFQELGVMLVFCMVLLMLVAKLPSLVASIITGSGIGNAGGIGNFGAGAVIGAAATAAAAMGVAGSAIASGAANIAGGAQAIKAAFSAASAAASGSGGAMGDAGSSATPDDSSNGGGSGLAAAMGDSGNSNGEGSNSSSKSAGNDGDSSGGSSKSGGFSTSSDSGGSSGGSKALKAGKIAAGTVGHLAKGSWKAVKNKAADRISQTTGGKIAASINADTKSKVSKTDSQSKEGGNYLAPGKSEE